jgi:dehydrogenase/reductase SDR family member 1
MSPGSAATASRSGWTTATSRGHRLIANISFAEAARYVYGAAYRAAKAGLDKLTADLARELLPHQVTVVSVWPPLTTAEKVLAHAQTYDLRRAHPPALAGRAVAALAGDPHAIAWTGHALNVTDIAMEHGLTSNPGRSA